jgi:hypothetical protein
MCQIDPKENGGYCRPCKNLKMKWWREANPLEGEARKKMNARSYAHVYLKLGKIERKTCEACGADAEMHHDDYDKPLQVRWLCKDHHHSWHRHTKIAA